MPEAGPIVREWVLDCPEPEDVVAVRDAEGDVWDRSDRTVSAWTLRAGTHNTFGLTWNGLLRSYGPLREVVGDV